jgi:hypothetical protein
MYNVGRLFSFLLSYQKAKFKSTKSQDAVPSPELVRLIAEQRVFTLSRCYQTLETDINSLSDHGIQEYHPPLLHVSFSTFAEL